MREDIQSSNRKWQITGLPHQVRMITTKGTAQGLTLGRQITKERSNHVRNYATYCSYWVTASELLQNTQGTQN